MDSPQTFKHEMAIVVVESPTSDMKDEQLGGEDYNQVEDEGKTGRDTNHIRKVNLPPRIVEAAALCKGRVRWSPMENVTIPLTRISDMRESVPEKW
jgi:hypothetical protein